MSFFSKTSLDCSKFMTSEQSFCPIVTLIPPFFSFKSLHWGARWEACPETEESWDGRRKLLDSLRLQRISQWIKSTRCSRLGQSPHLSLDCFKIGSNIKWSFWGRSCHAKMNSFTLELHSAIQQQVRISLPVILHEDVFSKNEVPK